MVNPVELLRLYTLALVVWREARGEPPLGKLLVAQTIENRVKDPRWPTTYLGVITQSKQFSAMSAGDVNSVLFPAEGDTVWPDCVAAAEAVINAPTSFTLANHYHARSVNPTWANPQKIVDEAGNHIFYAL